MKEDNETKKKLLDCAKQEFMEKGYLQASLRKICTNAGVTTGALYFFFRDKEDLFAGLVEEPLKQLYQVMGGHYEQELLQAEQDITALRDVSDDIEVSRQIIRILFRHYDEFQLLLTKAQGSRFEACIDRFVAITEKHCRVIADKLMKGQRTGIADDFMIHWIAHVHIDIFIHILTHEISEESALKHMEIMLQYLLSGWFVMFQPEK